MESIAVAEKRQDIRELVDIDGQENDDNTFQEKSRWTEYLERTSIRHFTTENSFHFFLLIVHDKVINHIVIETNRLAEQTIVSKQKIKHARINRWTETNPEESKKWFLINDIGGFSST